MFIRINDNWIPPTLRDADRTQFISKPTRRLRRRPAFLRPQCKGVLIRASIQMAVRLRWGIHWGCRVRALFWVRRMN